MCAYLADFSKKIFEDGSLVTFTQKGIGDSQISSSKQIPFNGRIFIYNETEIMAEQIGDLTKMYRARSLDVQFRSSSYLSFRKMQAASSAKAAQ